MRLRYISLIVGPEGTVTAVSPRKVSAPEFSDAAVAAIWTWKFAPAKLNGQPTQTALRHRFVFDADNRDTGVDEAGTELLRRLKKNPGSISELKQLDVVPKPTYRVSPETPPGEDSGQVLVEFYIDKTGRARFPTR